MDVWQLDIIRKCVYFCSHSTFGVLLTNAPKAASWRGNRYTGPNSCTHGTDDVTHIKVCWYVYRHRFKRRARYFGGKRVQGRIHARPFRCFLGSPLIYYVQTFIQLFVRSSCTPGAINYGRFNFSEVLGTNYAMRDFQSMMFLCVFGAKIRVVEFARRLDSCGCSHLIT